MLSACCRITRFANTGSNGCSAEMVDHARTKGVKFDQPALGVTP